MGSGIRSRVVLAAVILGFAQIATREASAAGKCVIGCKVAQIACSNAIKYDYKGCKMICKHQWINIDKPQCTLPDENCSEELAARKLCLDLCKVPAPSLRAMCLSELASCATACTDKEGTCADACGFGPSSLTTCGDAAYTALKACKPTCNGASDLGAKGACLKGCATTDWATYDGCRSTFDTCMTSCP